MKINLTLGQRRLKNPFAICKSLGKKRGWTEPKLKRCVESVKRQLRGK